MKDATFAFDPTRDFAIERHIDAPPALVWAALTRPEHVAVWYMPRAWGRVAACHLDVRPGGVFRIDIAVGDGAPIPNLGCFLEAVPHERLVWTSMLFPGYRPAVFDDVPITAVVTLAASGSGTHYTFTALHRSAEECEQNRTSGFYDGMVIAVDQLVAQVLAMH